MIPLLVLSLGAIGAGFLFHDYFIGHDRAHFWGAALAVPQHDVLEAIHQRLGGGNPITGQGMHAGYLEAGWNRDKPRLTLPEPLEGVSRYDEIPLWRRVRVGWLS